MALAVRSCHIHDKRKSDQMFRTSQQRAYRDTIKVAAGHIKNRPKSATLSERGAELQAQEWKHQKLSMLRSIRKELEASLSEVSSKLEEGSARREYVPAPRINSPSLSYRSNASSSQTTTRTRTRPQSARTAREDWPSPNATAVHTLNKFKGDGPFYGTAVPSRRTMTLHRQEHGLIPPYGLPKWGWTRNSPVLYLAKNRLSDQGLLGTYSVN